MWEVVVGAILGTLTSVIIAEVYQVRANREMDRRLNQIQQLGERLDSTLQDVLYFAERAGEKADAAKEQAKEAWLAGVSGTPQDPAFPYRGTNWLLLTLAGHESKWWATYNQWKSLGGQVRRGERGTMAILYKPVSKTKINDEGEEKESSFALMRTFTLFHISQVDGDLDQFRERPKSDAEDKFVDYEPAEQAFSATGADVRYGGDRAFYLPSEDYIRLPPRESFSERHQFYGVMSHEFVHWSGHQSRLNRLPKLVRFGSQSYAIEELVAELGAAYLSNELGVPQSDDLSNVAAYLGHWLSVLQRDHTAILTAAAAASAAVDHILSYSRPKEDAEVESEELVESGK